MEIINPNEKERTAQELNRLELEVRPGIELIEAALYKCYYQNKALTSVYDHEAIKKIIAKWVKEWI